MIIESRPYFQDIILTHMEAPEAGIKVETINLGATIRSFITPDRDGNEADIILGYEGEACLTGNFPAVVIGRVANRIDNAEYTYKGVTHHLEKNFNGRSTLHGGSGVYAKKIFAQTEEVLEDAVRVTYSFKDTGEGGFPGNVDVKVIYTLKKDGSLTMQFKAVPDQDTPINMTNHGYFNLKGHACGTVEDQLLKINADYFLPARDDSTPTGEIKKVEGTAFDFRDFKLLSEGFATKDDQLDLVHTFDHTFCIRGNGLREGLVAIDPKSGRRLTISTDQPGAQLFLPPNDEKAPLAKDGAKYVSRQGFPNAPCFSQFPSVFVNAGEEYSATVVYFADTVKE